MLLPQEIAEKLTSDERMDLAAEVVRRWNQEWGVVSVDRTHGLRIVVALKDGTHHEVKLGQGK